MIVTRRAPRGIVIRRVPFSLTLRVASRRPLRLVKRTVAVRGAPPGVAARTMSDRPRRLRLTVWRTNAAAPGAGAGVAVPAVVNVVR